MSSNEPMHLIVSPHRTASGSSSPIADEGAHGPRGSESRTSEDLLARVPVVPRASSTCRGAARFDAKVPGDARGPPAFITASCEANKIANIKVFTGGIREQRQNGRGLGRGEIFYQDEWAMRAIRLIASLASLVVVALAFSRSPRPARQAVSTPPAAGSGAGWTFSITPYAWLPTVSTTYSYIAPRAGSVTNTISAGIGDYISDLNFALFLGGEARYDRFTIMTDLVYANASITTSNSHFSSVNLGLAPIDIPRKCK